MSVTLTSARDSSGQHNLSEPLWWFKEVVEPNYEDFIKDPKCIRKTANAVVTSYHFYERIFQYYLENGDPQNCLGSAKTASEFRSALIALCPELGQLADAADAVKHTLRTRVNNYGKVEMERSSTGALAHVEGGNDLRTVMTFWRNWLANHH
jgi:hypothetical protein